MFWLAIMVPELGVLGKKGLGHANLAIKISEKKSILTSVEAGNMKPNEKLIKKLGNALGIELLEKVEVQSGTSSIKLIRL